jgi:plasmid maintenance system antidote protein VapI
MKILDLTTVAERIGCSKGHVSKLINGKVKGTPQLPSLRLGRKRGVIEDTLEEYLKDNETKGRGE